MLACLNCLLARPYSSIFVDKILTCLITSLATNRWTCWHTASARLTCWRANHWRWGWRWGWWRWWWWQRGRTTGRSTRWLTNDHWWGWGWWQNNGCLATAWVTGRGAHLHSACWWTCWGWGRWGRFKGWGRNNRAWLVAGTWYPVLWAWGTNTRWRTQWFSCTKK